MILKILIQINIKILNGNFYFLLDIFVAYIESFFSGAFDGAFQNFNIRWDFLNIQHSNKYHQLIDF